MTLQQLRYIIEIAQSGSISLAAQRLFITQPSLSKSVADLEKEMGITIFYRGSRGVMLSPDGVKFRAYARQVVEQADLLEQQYKVGTPVRRLSGGNVQKVLVGREIDSTPTVLMTAYPVRGLDINSSYTIYGLLNQQKMKGVAVLLVGEDLDVLLELCDRILVLCGGQVSGIVDGRTTTKEEVGLLMTRFVKEAKEA